MTGGHRVLLIDDDASTRGLLSELLAGEGYETSTSDVDSLWARPGGPSRIPHARLLRTGAGARYVRAVRRSAGMMLPATRSNAAASSARGSGRTNSVQPISP